MTILIHSIGKTGHNTIINKKGSFMERSNIIIIVAHNCHTYTWINDYNV